MALLLITRLAVLSLILATSKQVGEYQDMRCWSEPKLDEVTAVLGPASPEERLARAARALGENAYAGHWHYQAYLAYRAMNNRAQAETELLEAIRNDPDNPRYFGALAEFYLHGGAWELALQAAREQVRLDPRNPLGHCLLARVLEVADDVVASRSEYKECKDLVTKLPSPSCKAVSSYGKVSDMSSNPGDSYFPSMRWDRGFRLEEGAVPKLLLLAPIFDRPCSVGIFSTIYFVPAEDEFIYVGGLKDHADSAIKRLNGRGPHKAPEGAMSSRDFHETQGPYGIDCPNREQLKSVLETAKQNLANRTNPIGAYWQAQAAWGRFSLGNAEGALNSIKAGLEAEPKNLLLYLAGARIASSTGDFESTRKFLARAYELGPDNPWVHFRLGELMERKGNVPEAMRYYTSCLEKLGVPEEVVFTDDWKEVRGTPSLAKEAERRLKTLGGSPRTKREE